jgi:hypothetical protein
VSTLILSWTTPVDPGGGNPGRQYNSPLIVGDWHNLYAVFNVVAGWSGSFGLSSEGVSVWFNRYPQPASPFTAVDPNANPSTDGAYMQVQTNNGGAGLQVSVDLYGDPGTLVTLIDGQTTILANQAAILAAIAALAGGGGGHDAMLDDILAAVRKTFS